MHLLSIILYFEVIGHIFVQPLYNRLPCRLLFYGEIMIIDFMSHVRPLHLKNPISLIIDPYKLNIPAKILIVNLYRFYFFSIFLSCHYHLPGSLPGRMVKLQPDLLPCLFHNGLNQCPRHSVSYPWHYGLTLWRLWFKLIFVGKRRSLGIVMLSQMYCINLSLL